MNEIFEGQIPFFNLLYSDEIYLAKEKKYTSKQTAKLSVVNEETVAYSSDVVDIHFNGITSPTLLLFNYPIQEDIPIQDKTFLNQILKAAGLGFENLAWLNTASLPQSTTWSHIIAQSPSEFVISFGIEKRYLPDGIADGQIYNNNGKRILCASALSEISENSIKKKLLWQGLKEIYGL